MSDRETVLWIDAAAGASGDMILGALIDMGAAYAGVEKAIAALKLRGVRLKRRRVMRCGVAATKIDVVVPGSARDDHHVHHDGTPHGHGRRWADLRRVIASARLAPPVRDRALVVFRRLIEAEAAAHGAEPRSVHLHEAGAADAIADVVGICAALQGIGPDRVIVSPLTTGSGTVRCAHGVYPVPGPATSLLLRGAPTSGIAADGERLTPTGAAVLTSVANGYGGLPEMTVERVGFGAGSRDDTDRPNVVRAISGSRLRSHHAEDGSETPSVLVIDLTVDDATPQVLAYAVERLFAAGALDVHTTPVQMKKGRAGHHVTILARATDFDAIARAALTETTTLGLRFHREDRIEMVRAVESVRTPFGRIRVKVGRLRDAEVHATPEYEDCAAAARKHHVPLISVQQAALAARSPRKRGRR